LALSKCFWEFREVNRPFSSPLVAGLALRVCEKLISAAFAGCGACKAAKEPFFQAALEASEELPGTKLALCNAAKHQRFAEEYSIKVCEELSIGIFPAHCD